MHVIIVVCYHSLFCWVDASLFLHFKHSIPTSFNILNTVLIHCGFIEQTDFELYPFYSCTVLHHLSMECGMHVHNRKWFPTNKKVSQFLLEVKKIHLVKVHTGREKKKKKKKKK